MSENSNTVFKRIASKNTFLHIQQCTKKIKRCLKLIKFEEKGKRYFSEKDVLLYRLYDSSITL